MFSSSNARRRALPRLHTAIDFRTGQLLGNIEASMQISPSHFLPSSASDYSKSPLRSIHSPNDKRNSATAYSPAMLPQFDLLVPTGSDIDVTCFELPEELCDPDMQAEVRDGPSLSGNISLTSLLSSISKDACSKDNREVSLGPRNNSTLLDRISLSSLLYSPSEDGSSPDNLQSSIGSCSPTSSEYSVLVLKLRGGDRAVAGSFRTEQYDALEELDESPENDTAGMDADELAAHRANPVAEWGAFQRENARHEQLFMDASIDNRAEMAYEELHAHLPHSPSSSVDGASRDSDGQVLYDVRARPRRNATAGLQGVPGIVALENPLNRNVVANIEDISSEAPRVNPLRRSASAAGLDDDMEVGHPATRRRRNATATGINDGDDIQPARSPRQLVRPAAVPRREGLWQWQRRMGSVLPGSAIPPGLTTVPEEPISPAQSSPSGAGPRSGILRPDASAIAARARPVFVFGQGVTHHFRMDTYFGRQARWWVALWQRLRTAYCSMTGRSEDM